MNMQGRFLLQKAVTSAPGISVFKIIMTDASAFWTRVAINEGNPLVVKVIGLLSYNRFFDFPRSTLTNMALREELCIVCRTLFGDNWEMHALRSNCFKSQLSLQVSSVAQSCLTLCDPMNHSTPGPPVHHQLLEFTQTHVHWVGDAIQPSHPLSSPSPPAPNPFQHQILLQWVNSSHQVAKVLEFQLQHQSFQWTPRTDLL